MAAFKFSGLARGFKDNLLGADIDLLKGLDSTVIEGEDNVYGNMATVHGARNACQEVRHKRVP